MSELNSSSNAQSTKKDSQKPAESTQKVPVKLCHGFLLNEGCKCEERYVHVSINMCFLTLFISTKKYHWPSQASRKTAFELTKAFEIETKHKVCKYDEDRCDGRCKGKLHIKSAQICWNFTFTGTCDEVNCERAHISMYTIIKSVGLWASKEKAPTPFITMKSLSLVKDWERESNAQKELKKRFNQNTNK